MKKELAQKRIQEALDNYKDLCLLFDLLWNEETKDWEKGHEEVADKIFRVQTK